MLMQCNANSRKIKRMPNRNCESMKDASASVCTPIAFRNNMMDSISPVFSSFLCPIDSIRNSIS